MPGSAMDEHVPETWSAERLALAAATAAGAPLGDLLQIASEGAAGCCRSMEEDTIPQLADALKMTIELAVETDQGPKDEGGRELLGQLYGALQRFLEAWA